MFADLASTHPRICPKTPGRHSLASAANPRPHCQRSSFAYTAKPNLKQPSTAENWLVGPEKNTDSADGVGPAVSRDAQISRTRPASQRKLCELSIFKRPSACRAEALRRRVTAV